MLTHATRARITLLETKWKDLLCLKFAHREVCLANVISNLATSLLTQSAFVAKPLLLVCNPSVLFSNSTTALTKAAQVPGGRAIAFEGSVFKLVHQMDLQP